MAAPLASLALCELGYVAYAQGNRALAVARLEESLGQDRALGYTWQATHALVGLGFASHDAGDQARALDLFHESLALSWSYGDRRALATALTGVAVVAVVLGQLERAARLFGALEALYAAIGMPDAAVFSSRRARVERGVAAVRAALDPDAFAAAWAAGRALPLEQAIAEAAAVTPAPSLPHAGSTDAAAPYGLTAREDVLIADRVARARNLWLAGETEKAIDTIELALGAAATEGLVRSLVEAGPHVLALLEAAKKTSKYPTYIDRLLSARADDATTSVLSMSPTLSGNEQLVEPLSERELEVLRLIAAGRTNGEIAESLYLAVGTVKRHTHNIYGKLDVRTRTQAVARANALGLLVEA
jgi:LuxR family maltose regulon positive regulatory protein